MQQVPLLAGEIGEHVSNSDCGSLFLNSFLTWADTHNASCEVWKWGIGTDTAPCDNDALITDYAGTPSPVYGEAYKAHLASLANTALSSQSMLQQPAPTRLTSIMNLSVYILPKFRILICLMLGCKI